jgi:hypothetical protein
MGRLPAAQLLLALVLGTAMAGCAKASGEPTAASPEEPIIAPTAAVSDALGAVHGSVVDSSVYPLGEANVTLEPASSIGNTIASTVTGPDGAFVFSLLEPGAYRVMATHPNYGGGSALVQVQAGEVSKANVVLSDVPGDVPYVLLFLETGFMPCAFSVVAWADSCATGLPGEQINRFRYNISAGFSYVVVETDWQPGTVTMDHDFWAREAAPDGEEAKDFVAVGRGFGQPILRVDFWPEKPYVIALDAATEAPTLFPPSTKDIQFQVDTWYDGQYQAEVNGAGGPACAYMLLGYCTGVGLQLEHRFQQYTTVFMNGAPDAIEEYSAVPDQ